MIANYVMGVMFAALPIVAAASACKTGLPIGRIERVDLTVKDKEPNIRRMDGTTVKATAYTWLCQGDRFDIEGDAKVFATFGGTDEPPFDRGRTLIQDGKQPLVVHDPGVIDVIMTLLDRLPATRMVIQYFPESREPGRPPPKLLADPLLPAGPQTLPTGYSRVALLWRGGSGVVRVQSATTMSEFSSSHRSYAIVDLPQPTELVNIALDRDIVWNVTFAGDDSAATPADRIARAIVILRDGPVERRLFALSELASLAAQGEYVAEQLWTAARTGDLARVFRTP